MAIRHPMTLPALALPAVLAAGFLASSAPVRAQDPTPSPRSDAPRTRSSSRDAYILSIGGEWMSSGVDFDHLADDRPSGRRDFLWFRRGDRTWIADDAAAVRRADSLFEPLRALEPEQEALRDRETALDDRENALDAEEESIDAAIERLEPEEDSDEEVDAPPPPTADDDRERDGLERRREELREQQRALRVEQRAFEREERALDKREEDLEREAEAKLWKLADELVARGSAKPVK